jgi:polysaccharide export outer membrane protein
MTVRFAPVFVLSLLLTSVASAQNGSPVPANPPAAAPVSSAAAPAVNPAAPAVTPAPPAVSRAAGDTSKDYRIGPEDVLEVWVFDQKDPSRIVPVRPDGKISLPFVNDVVAAGRTAAELRDIITQGLTNFVTRPEVSVMVREINSRKVSVQGDVRMPGLFKIEGDATVLDMLSKAQGFTDYANRKDIIILRDDGKQRLKFNWDRVVNGDDPDIAVQPGDVIIVRR